MISVLLIFKWFGLMRTLGSVETITNLSTASLSLNNSAISPGVLSLVLPIYFVGDACNCFTVVNKIIAFEI